MISLFQVRLRTDFTRMLYGYLYYFATKGARICEEKNEMVMFGLLVEDEFST